MYLELICCGRFHGFLEVFKTQCVGVEKTDDEDSLSLGRCIVSIMEGHDIL